MKNQQSTSYGTGSTTTNTKASSNTTYYGVPRFYVRVVASPELTRGNKRDPNNFLFYVNLATAGAYYRNVETPIAGTRSFANVLVQSYEMVPNYTEPNLLTANYNITSDRALEKIYDQTKGGNTPNLATDFFERGQTKKLLKDTTSFRSLVRDFVRNVVSEKAYRNAGNRVRVATRNSRARAKGKTRQARYDSYRVSDSPDMNSRQLAYVEKKWLEYRYGWTPLCNSIYDTIEQINHTAATKPVPIRGRSGHRMIDTSKSPLQGGEQVLSRKMTFRTQFMAYYVPSESSLLSISRFTSLNPLKWAWEATTLSFVADWVINVAQQLDLLENHLLYGPKIFGVVRTDSYIQESTFSSRQFYQSNFGLDGNGNYDGSGSRFTQSVSASAVVKGFNRQIIGGPPLPSMELRFKPNITWKRALDGLALLSGALRPRRK